MSGIAHDTNWWEATGPDDQVPTRDFPFAYSRDMVGHWGSPDSDTVVHEVGHAMGLGDDYFVMSDDNGNRVQTGNKAEPELGEANSIMANQRHAPDSIVVFRILAQMQEAGVLPQCTRDLFTVYEWEGDIKKEFVQQANQDPVPKLTGKWVEQFHVKFVQVPTDSRGSHTHKDGTSSDSYSDNFYPLALDYTLVPTYSEAMPGNHRIEINGSATGKLRRDTLLKPSGREKNVPETDRDNDRGSGREVKWVRLPVLKGMDRVTISERLGGEVLRIFGDHPGNLGRDERRNSEAEECAFYGDLPGDFRLTIDLGAQGNGTVDWTDQEKQALLRGIAISGTNLYGKNAEGPRDVSQFNHLIRADICGRILRAEQKEVTGSRSFEVKESGGIPGQKGQITWNLRRTARQVPYEKK